MAQLTWRNVDAPDLRGSLEGIKVFTDSLGSAFEGLDKGLTRFDDGISKDVNQRVALEIAAAQDAEAAKALVANLASRPDARRISTQAIAAAAARPTELIDQATKQLGLKTAEYSTNRMMDANTRTDAARADANAYYTLNAAGKAEDAAKLLASSENLRGLNSDQINALVTSGQNLIKGDVGIAGDRIENVGKGLRNEGQVISNAGGIIGNKAAAFTLETAQRDDADRQSAAAAIGAINFGSMDADTARQNILGLRGQLTPGAMALVMQQTNQMFPGTFGTSEIPSYGAGSGAGSDFTYAAPQKAVASVLSGSGMSDAVVAGFLGNLHVEGGYNGAQGDGGSAGGIAQWRNERRTNFKRIIGKDPTKASVEEQAKFIKWEMDNPKEAGMTIAQRDAILRAKTPQEAAALIDEHFERSDGKSTTARMTAAQQAASALVPNVRGAQTAATLIAGRASQDTGPGINGGKLISKLDEDASISEVSGALIAGDFKGVPRPFIEDQIKRVVREAGVSNAVAGEMLTRALGGSADSGIIKFIRGVKGRLTGDTTPNLAGGRRIDDDVLNRDIEAAKSGKLYGRAVEAQSSAAVQATLATAQNDAQTKYARLQAALNRGGMDAQIPRLKAQSDAAAANLQALLRSLAQKDQFGRTANMPR